MKVKCRLIGPILNDCFNRPVAESKSAFMIGIGGDYDPHGSLEYPLKVTVLSHLDFFRIIFFTFATKSYYLFVLVKLP